MNLAKLFTVLISIPKTIFFNFRVLPFKDAIKLPFFISYNTQIGEVHRGVILINQKLSIFMIRIGIGGTKGVCANRKGYISFGKNAKIIFDGFSGFSEGSSIRVDKGTLMFGANFSANKNFFISCSESISIGDNVLIGWNVNIRDSDGHVVYPLDEAKYTSNMSGSVEIGNNVWLAANVDILKGVEIPSDCVVGYNSCVTKKFKENNCLIAGYPAKIIKHKVAWEK